MRLAWIALAAVLAPGLSAASDPFEFKGPAGKVSESFSHFTQPIRGLPSYQERLDAELEASVSDNTYGAKLVPWAWVRVPDAIGGLPRKTRGYFELKEGWIERTGPALDIRIGNQLLAWGAADQINPTDVWNARDLYDPFQSYKLPLTVARVKVHPPEAEWLSVELVGTPLFRESRLPVDLPGGTAADVPLEGSRWLLPLPSTVVTGGFRAPLFYRITEPNYPATWQAGARVSLQRLGGWDFSASYFNGVESTPRFAVTRSGSAASAALPITLTLNPSFHRMQMWGVDGAGSVALFGHDFGTRFEAAYFARDNSRAEAAAPELRGDLIKDDYVHAVAGVDYTFPKKILGTVIYWNLQYVHYRRLEGRENRPGQTVIEGLPNAVPWDSDFVLYVEDRLTDTVKIAHNTLYSVEHGDFFLSPSFQVSWTDNLKTTLGADLFLGNDRGFFGQFHDNRRVTFGASHSF